VKSFFILHGDDLALLKADWVAARYPMAGYIVVNEKRPPLLSYLSRRARRLGVLRVADELMLRAWYTLVCRRRDNRHIAVIRESLVDGVPASFRRPPTYRVDNINSSESQELFKSLQPDVCVATVNVLLKSEIFSIPEHGVLVYHPGITPEYRGVHAAFWATLRGEFDQIGWSLLKIDEGIDTGHVVAQGVTAEVDPCTESHVVMQHKAHVDGLMGIVESLQQIEAGGIPRVETAGRQSRYFSHPGLTDYYRSRRQLAALCHDRRP